MRKGLASILLAFGLTLILGGMAWAEGPDGEGLPFRPLVRASAPTVPALSLAYGQIINGGAPVYASLSDAAAGIAPVDWIAPGFVFVSLARSAPLTFANAKWYQLYQGGYVSAQHILPYPPSRFQGIQVDRQPDKPFAWVIADSPISNTPGAQPKPNAPRFNRYAQVTLIEPQAMNGTTWYRVGQNEWISQYRLGIISVAPRPPAIGPTDKWIEVNVFEQTLAAYEGDQMVYATLVSSGLPQWYTTPGLFHIYDKVKQGLMTGQMGKPDYYYLQDIPWIMYYNGDQALHTAYWHDGFGETHSHGCVNLPPQDAMWLFNWTTPIVDLKNETFASKDNPGTFVWVHY